jgi:hypothetical protein
MPTEPSPRAEGPRAEPGHGEKSASTIHYCDRISFPGLRGDRYIHHTGPPTGTDHKQEQTRQGLSRRADCGSDQPTVNSGGLLLRQPARRISESYYLGDGSTAKTARVRRIRKIECRQCFDRG